MELLLSIEKLGLWEIFFKLIDNKRAFFSVWMYTPAYPIMHWLPIILVRKTVFYYYGDFSGGFREREREGGGGNLPRHRNFLDTKFQINNVTAMTIYNF